MNRQQYTEARRAVRTFHTLCSLAVDQSEAGDLDLMHSAERWTKAVYRPLNAEGRLVAIWVSTQPSSGGFGPSIPLLRQDPEQLRLWLQHFRQRRCFRSSARAQLPV